MRAVAYKTPQPIAAETSLIDVELPTPEAKGHDLLVEIKAVSVNPVDVKVRANMAPPADELKVLGYDAAGIVKVVGSDVTLFKRATRSSIRASSIAPAPMPNSSSSTSALSVRSRRLSTSPLPPPCR